MNQMQIRHVAKRIDEIAEQKLRALGYTGNAKGGYYRNRSIPEDVQDQINKEITKDAKAFTASVTKKDVLSVVLRAYGSDKNMSIPIPSTVIKLRDKRRRLMDKWLEEVDKRASAIKVEASKIKDRLILGDAEEALKALKAFEKKKF